MSLSRVKVWTAEVLSPTDLNSEFDNVLNYLNNGVVDFSSIYTDGVAEHTVGNGVNIDGVTLKDSQLVANGAAAQIALIDSAIVYTRGQKTTGIAQSTTVDVFRFFATNGTTVIGTNFFSGYVIYNIVDEASAVNNTSGMVWCSGTGNGATVNLVPFLNSSSNPTQTVRGTTLVAVSPISAVVDGASGAAKLQLTTSASGKTVTCRIAFFGVIL